MAGAYTGDGSKQVQSVAICQRLPVVLQADLEDASAPINQLHLSGKQAGAMVIRQATLDGALSIVIASGSATTDTWGNSAGVVVDTPA